MHEVEVKKKDGARLWYIKLNGRITGAASTRRAALDMAIALQDRLDKNPQIEVKKRTFTKVKTGAVSKAAQKRMANRKASQ